MARKPQEGSLGSKLMQLRLGESFILFEPKDFDESVATPMERQVTNIIAKSNYLSGRKFRTWRCDVIRDRNLYRALGIEREL